MPKINSYRAQVRRPYIRNYRNKAYVRTTPKKYMSKIKRQSSYSYQYKVNKGTVGIGAGVAFNYNALYFLLTDINNSAELTALYDEYKISKIKIEFIPRATNMGQAISTATTGNANQIYGTVQPFVTAIDFDDAVAPTSRNAILQYGTARVSTPHTKVTRTFVPKIAVQTYKTIASSGYMAKGNQWLDCADDTVPHYGLKWAWDQDANAVSTTLYDIYCTYYVSFRGVR